MFTAFSVRITNLFKVIDEVAFQRLDIRLAQKLLDHVASDQRVSMTHQQLAAELGTAREVVSRQLHEFQRRVWNEFARKFGWNGRAAAFIATTKAALRARRVVVFIFGIGFGERRKAHAG